MGNSQSTNGKREPARDVIAAFDREREKAHEHRRQLAERIRVLRENDRPANTQPHKQ